MFGIGAWKGVWQVMAPCEVACKCLGIIPLFLDSKLPLWKQWVNVGHLLLTFGLIVRAIWHCLPMELILNLGSTVVQHSGALMTIVYYAQPFCGVITNRLVATQIFEIQGNIDLVQNRFKSLGYELCFRKERYAIIVSTFSAFSGTSYLLLLFKVYGIMIDVEYTIETIFLTLHCSMTCVYVSCMTYLILKQFISVNALISKTFPTNKVSSVETTNSTKCNNVSHYNEEQQLVNLNEIKMIMDKLNETVDLVNHTFSIQVLYCVGVSFVIGIVCSFYLFRAVIYRNDQLAMGAINFIWYMYYLSFVLFFIAIGSRISQEGRRIGITVHKAINFCNTSGTVINELIIFSQQLLHHNPVITCGLFVYDWSLLYTMLGATATYLIILIQFDVSFPSLDVGNSTTSSL
ncbi:uncharacterized protein LOC23687622 isoform X1 [Aedes aegypti]|uniref:Gustatory receptor n=1 Tax=Aedes aegypti TaxID=7159 RepID=A0A6I8U772_AEDAE|nr:gustatory receptor 61 isoform Gr61a [Aedes aegypti]